MTDIISDDQDIMLRFQRPILQVRIHNRNEVASTSFDVQFHDDSDTSLFVRQIIEADMLGQDLEIGLIKLQSFVVLVLVGVNVENELDFSSLRI